MPRPKLHRNRDYIQVVIDADDKTAFEAWCAANGTTMSDVIRARIASYIVKGKKIKSDSSLPPGTAAS